MVAPVRAGPWTNSKAGRPDAVVTSQDRRRKGILNIQDARGWITGKIATRGARKAPSHMRKPTSKPAMADTKGEKGLSLPKTKIDNGAVAARDAKPTARTLDSTGGIQRCRQKSSLGEKTEMPATAR
jgi:hypothetical protein